MKKIAKLSLWALLFINICMAAQSQDLTNYGGETYVKRNIALTKFKVLGVNSKQYAKCAESVNFLETEKKLRYTVIDRVEFADDGANYDLVANDGIMTSRTLFTYSEGTAAVDAGRYTTPQNEVFVYDTQFAYSGTGRAGGPSLGITCDLRWRECSSWPSNLQSICREFSWPFTGYLEATNCRITFGIF